MRILFVSRAYPPTLGGIENQNAELAKSLGAIVSTTVIANTRGKRFLPLFLPYAAIRILCSFSRYDAILLGDAVLAPLVVPVRILSRKTRLLSVVHGLDITFFRKTGLLARIYHWINIPSLRLLDRLIAVGNPTREEAIRIGIRPKNVSVIPNGIFPDRLKETHTREELSRLLGVDTAQKKIILRVGRFVRHKGTEWFIRNVMPRLPEDTIFVAAGGVVADKTAGDANTFPDCERTIREFNLEKRVRLLPNIPQAELLILLNTVDLVVSPNIPVPGSMEGFGINVIEAAGCSRVVVASDLEGLKDAISNGVNGFLIPPNNTDAFVQKISTLLADNAFRADFGEQAREYVVNNFSWEHVARRYADTLSETTEMKR